MTSAPGTRRTLHRSLTVVSVAAILAIPATAAAALTPAALPGANIGPVIGGTVTWTTVTTVNKDESDEFGSGDLITSTSTDTATMKIKLRRDGQYDRTFNVQDVGSTYDASLTTTGKTLERNIDAVVECTITKNATAAASGRFPARPTSTTPPALFAHVVPGINPPALGPKTKGIVLTPIIRITGTETTAYVGSGLSPCADATDVDPLVTNALVSDSAERICYPKGTSAAKIPANGAELVGVWKQATKRFVFDCSQTWTTPDATITTTIRGSLRYG